MLAGAFLCAVARADDTPQQKLDAVEKALQESHARQEQLTQEAAALAAEIAMLRDQSVNAAQAAQQHEASLSQLEERLTTLGADEKRKVDELAEQRDKQSKLLMALVRLAHNPPEEIALAPGDPVDVLRGALLLDAAMRPIQAHTKELSDAIAALAALRDEIAATWQRYSAEHDALVADQLRINTIIAHKADLQQRATKGAAEIGRHQEQLAAAARDLHELIDRLEAERRPHDDNQRRPDDQGSQAAAAATAPPPAAPLRGSQSLTLLVQPPPADPAKPHDIRPFGEARGRMRVPASGRLVRRYGESDDFGVTSKGLTFATRAAAQVVAPFDGRILFAGPFKGYGEILIIGHGDGYHSLLAGLDRVDGAVGQWLVTGEPVGVMAGGSGKHHLYLELRHNNQPINPVPWLALRDEKVSG